MQNDTLVYRNCLFTAPAKGRNKIIIKKKKIIIIKMTTLLCPSRENTNSMHSPRHLDTENSSPMARVLQKNRFWWAPDAFSRWIAYNTRVYINGISYSAPVRARSPVSRVLYGFHFSTRTSRNNCRILILLSLSSYLRINYHTSIYA